MLRWFLRRMIAKFEREFDYDASYADDLIDHAPIALLWLFLGPRIVRRPRELPVEAWVAAGLVGAMEADCGPCTQLGVRWAQKMGVKDDTLRAIITGYEDAMSEDVRLATRYTRAALRHDIDAEGFRAEIEQRWGKNVLVRRRVCDHRLGAVPDDQIWPRLWPGVHACAHWRSRLRRPPRDS